MLAPSTGEAGRPLSVTEIVTWLHQAVATQVGRQRVIGEIGSYKMSSGGHAYFTLKDGTCELQCVFYHTQLSRCPMRLDVGMLVELDGRAEVYTKRGLLQFVVERAQATGVGALLLQFEALKNKLRAEGLFDSGRKRIVPEFPRSVGLVTSAKGAVIEDMRHRLSERAPWIRAYLLPVPVQGRGAEKSIARAIRMWSDPARYRLPPVDYLVVARGGGSLEDLWCFNEEIVARAIAACPVPVVTAIGHETDTTLADMASDLRAPTPTAAIELTTPDAKELDARFVEYADKLRRRLASSLELARARMQAAVSDKLLHPMTALEPFLQTLDKLEEKLRLSARARLAAAGQRLERAAGPFSPQSLRLSYAAAAERLHSHSRRLLETSKARLAERVARLDGLEASLRAASPQNALERGFALVSGTDGRLVRDAAALAPGSPLRLRFAKGGADAQVISLHDGHPAAPLSAAPPRRTRRRRGPQDDTPSLF